MPILLDFMRVSWYNFLMKTQKNSQENLHKIYQELRAENEQLRQQVQWLMEQLKLSKHKQFGAQSEQAPLDQLCLFSALHPIRLNKHPSTISSIPEVRQ